MREECDFWPKDAFAWAEGGKERGGSGAKKLRAIDNCSQIIMDAEEDDDIYASGTANSAPNATNTSGTNAFPSQATDVQKPADLEEGEEEDEEEEEEESDSVLQSFNTM